MSENKRRGDTHYQKRIEERKQAAKNGLDKADIVKWWKRKKEQIKNILNYK